MQELNLISCNEVTLPISISLHTENQITAIKKKGISQQLYYPTQAATTKYHILGDLHSSDVFPYSYGDWKSKIKLPARLVSGEVPLLGLQMATFLPAIPIWPFCALMEKGWTSKLSGVSSSEDTGPIEIRDFLWPYLT